MGNSNVNVHRNKKNNERNSYDTIIKILILLSAYTKWREVTNTNCGDGSHRPFSTCDTHRTTQQLELLRRTGKVARIVTELEAK